MKNMLVEGRLRTKHWGKYLTYVAEGREDILPVRWLKTENFHDFFSSPKAGRAYVMDH